MAEASVSLAVSDRRTRSRFAFAEFAHYLELVGRWWWCPLRLGPLSSSRDEDWLSLPIFIARTRIYAQHSWAAHTFNASIVAVRSGLA